MDCRASLAVTSLVQGPYAVSAQIRATCNHNQQ